jgi:hypothetical protein
MMRNQIALAIAGAMGRMTMPFQTQRDVRVNRRAQSRMRGGSVRRAPVRNPEREHAAQAKRDQRNGHRLSTWTGVRHDTIHVPSTVIKLLPRMIRR